MPGQCKEGREAAISWNSDGQQGPKGDQGEPGAPGQAQCAASPVTVEFALVGITDALVDAVQTLWTVDELCDAEFPGSRMCRLETETKRLGPGVGAQETVDAIPSHTYDASTDKHFGGAFVETMCDESDVGAAAILYPRDPPAARMIFTSLSCNPTVTSIDTSELRPVACCARVR